MNKSLPALFQLPFNLVLASTVGESKCVFVSFLSPLSLTPPALTLLSLVTARLEPRKKEQVENIILDSYCYTWLQYSHTVTCAQMLTLPLRFLFCVNTQATSWPLDFSGIFSTKALSIGDFLSTLSKPTFLPGGPTLEHEKYTLLPMGGSESYTPVPLS